jgi:serine/threonine protein kinase
VLGQLLDGKYLLERSLGGGGMGEVFQARHVGSGLRVAVKVMSALGKGPNDVLAQRFQREAHAAGALESPHIAQLLDSGVDPARRQPYLVMELLQGEDLHALLRREGPLAPAVAVRIAAQVCLALRRAHAAGVLHRAIQPANVFLAHAEGDEVTVKLLGFGVAKLRAELGPDPTAQRHGGGVGSPAYMSPEQARGGRELDARADLWSLGVVLYEALAGRTPHAEVQAFGELLIAICSEPAPPLGRLAPWVSPDLAAVVQKALAIDRDARFGSADELLGALRELEPGGMLERGELVGLSDSAKRARHGASIERTEREPPNQALLAPSRLHLPALRAPRRRLSPWLVVAAALASALLTLALLMALAR